MIVGGPVYGVQVVYNDPNFTGPWVGSRCVVTNFRHRARGGRVYELQRLSDGEFGWFHGWMLELPHKCSSDTSRFKKHDSVVAVPEAPHPISRARCEVRQVHRCRETRAWLLRVKPMRDSERDLPDYWLQQDSVQPVHQRSDSQPPPSSSLVIPTESTTGEDIKITKTFELVSPELRSEDTKCPNCGGVLGASDECAACVAAVACPHGPELHHHHDGCPSCSQHESEERIRTRLTDGLKADWEHRGDGKWVSDLLVCREPEREQRLIAIAVRTDEGRWWGNLALSWADRPLSERTNLEPTKTHPPMSTAYECASFLAPFANQLVPAFERCKEEQQCSTAETEVTKL